MKVVGVDGCKGGWIAVLWDTEMHTVEPIVYASLKEIIEANPDASAIGIDIPIGLSDTGTRQCDLCARKLLGKPRSSSVFPPPVFEILDIATFAEAVIALNKRIGKGISKQSFAIFPKILEASQTITPDMQTRVFEVHPEVSFLVLGKGPMAHKKSSAEGFAARRSLLEAAMRITIPEKKVVASWAKPAKPDDILDAMVAAWTARRVVQQEAIRFPAQPLLDGRGIRMEILA
jgi:predicted RNase H-like nuclease